jgi:Spy/CpxP family protein refolding chaperone
MLGLAASLSAPVFAQQPGPSAPGPDTHRDERGDGPHQRGRRGGDMAFMRILRELNLTAAQAAQARTIAENHMAAIKPQREELFKLREQREQGADQADVSARAKELREQIQESTKNMRAQLLAILTAEQRAKFDQMEKEFKARRDEMRERHRDRQENDQQ